MDASETIVACVAPFLRRSDVQTAIFKAFTPDPDRHDPGEDRRPAGNELLLNVPETETGGPTAAAGWWGNSEQIQIPEEFEAGESPLTNLATNRSGYKLVVRSHEDVHKPIVFADAEAILLGIEVTGFERIISTITKKKGVGWSEVVHGIAGRYLCQIVDIVDSFGGEIAKFMGDIMFVKWDLSPNPSTRSREILEAITCGVQLLTELADYNVEFNHAPTHQSPLSVDLEQAAADPTNLALLEYAGVGAPADPLLHPPGGGASAPPPPTTIMLKMKLAVAVGVVSSVVLGTWERMDYSIYGPAVDDLSDNLLSSSLGELLVPLAVWQSIQSRCGVLAQNVVSNSDGHVNLAKFPSNPFRNPRTGSSKQSRSSFKNSNNRRRILAADSAFDLRPASSRSASSADFDPGPGGGGAGGTGAAPPSPIRSSSRPWRRTPAMRRLSETDEARESQSWWFLALHAKLSASRPGSATSFARVRSVSQNLGPSKGLLLSTMLNKLLLEQIVEGEGGLTPASSATGPKHMAFVVLISVLDTENIEAVQRAVNKPDPDGDEEKRLRAAGLDAANFSISVLRKLREQGILCSIALSCAETFFTMMGNYVRSDSFVLNGQITKTMKLLAIPEATERIVTCCENAQTTLTAAVSLIHDSSRLSLHVLGRYMVRGSAKPTVVVEITDPTFSGWRRIHGSRHRSVGMDRHRNEIVRAVDVWLTTPAEQSGNPGTDKSRADEEDWVLRGLWPLARFESRSWGLEERKLFVVVGNVGYGKSLLASEVKQEVKALPAASAVHVCHVCSLPDHGPRLAFGALRRSIVAIAASVCSQEDGQTATLAAKQDAVGILEAAFKDAGLDRRYACVAALVLGFRLADASPALGSMMAWADELAPRQRVETTMAAVLAVLQHGIATGKKYLFLVDDYQVFVIILSRPLGPGHSLKAGLQRLQLLPGCRNIELEILSANHISDLLMHLWGGRGAGIRRVDPSLCDMIFRTTSGDPLFTTLLCRALRTRTALGKTPGSGSANGTGAQGGHAGMGPPTFESVLYRSKFGGPQKRMSVEAPGLTGIGVGDSAVEKEIRRKSSVAQANGGKDVNVSPLLIDDEGVLRSRKWPALDLTGVNLVDLVQGIYERMGHNSKRTFSVACIFGQAFTIDDLLGGLDGSGTAGEVLQALEEDVDGFIIPFDQMDPDLLGALPTSSLPPEPPTQPHQSLYQHQSRRNSQMLHDDVLLQHRRPSHSADVQLHAPRERRGSHISEKLFVDSAGEKGGHSPLRERRGSHYSERITSARSSHAYRDSHVRTQQPPPAQVTLQQRQQIYCFQSEMLCSILYECQNFLTRQSTHARLGAYLQNRHEKGVEAVAGTTTGGATAAIPEEPAEGERTNVGTSRKSDTLLATSLALSRIAFHYEKANNVCGLMGALGSLAKLFYETFLVEEAKFMLQKVIGLAGGGWGNMDDGQRAEWLVMLAEMHLEAGDRIKAEECLNGAFKLLKIYFPKTFIGRYIAKWKSLATLKLSLAMAISAASTQSGSKAIRRRSEGTLSIGRSGTVLGGTIRRSGTINGGTGASLIRRRKKGVQTPKAVISSLIGNQEHEVTGSGIGGITELNLSPTLLAEGTGNREGGGMGEDSKAQQQNLGQPRPPPPSTTSRAFTCLYLASKEDLHNTMAVWLSCEGLTRAFHPSSIEVTVGTGISSGNVLTGGPGCSGGGPCRRFPAIHVVLRSVFPVLHFVLAGNDAKRRRWLRNAVLGAGTRTSLASSKPRGAAASNVIVPSTDRNASTMTGYPVSKAGGSGIVPGIEVTGSSELERMLVRVMVEYMAKEPPASPLAMQVFAELAWFFFEEGFCSEAHVAFRAAAETAHVMDDWRGLVKLGAGLLATSTLLLDFTTLFSVIEPRLQLLYPSTNLPPSGAAKEYLPFASAHKAFITNRRANVTGSEAEHHGDGEALLALGTLLVYCLKEGRTEETGGLSATSRSCFQRLLKELVGGTAAAGPLGRSSVVSGDRGIPFYGGNIAGGDSIPASLDTVAQPDKPNTNISASKLTAEPSDIQAQALEPVSSTNPASPRALPSRTSTMRKASTPSAFLAPPTPAPPPPQEIPPPVLSTPNLSPAPGRLPQIELASTKTLKLLVTSLCYAITDDLGAAARSLSSALDATGLRGLKAEAKRDLRHRIASLPLIAMAFATTTAVLLYQGVCGSAHDGMASSKAANGNPDTHAPDPTLQIPNTSPTSAGLQAVYLSVVSSKGSSAIPSTFASLNALRSKAGDYRAFVRFFRKHYGLTDPAPAAGGKGGGDGSATAAHQVRTTAVSSPSCHLESLALLSDTLATVLEASTVAQGSTAGKSSGHGVWTVGEKGVKAVKNLKKVLEAMGEVEGTAGFRGTVGALARAVGVAALTDSDDASKQEVLKELVRRGIFLFA
ncbi:hypothetical protein HDU96_001400 [Phlyctochytrium bullatum]|nr:hypothetical protein HDU96_001400 [Phlyctochytrium bullatum]